jgi:hypothetical protein
MQRFSRENDSSGVESNQRSRNPCEHPSAGWSESHHHGTFFDPRLKNEAQFPIGAAAGFGDMRHQSDLGLRVAAHGAAA